jgi:zinc protease
VAGDIEPKTVLELLERRLGPWKASPGLGPVPQVPQAPARRENPVETAEAMDTAQTHIALGFLAPGMGHPDHAPLEVLAGHLNGLGGLMFNELRNKRSLAYAVGSSYNPGLSVGGFAFYIASDPQKASEAVGGMLGIIDDIRTKPLEAEAVSGAIRYVSGNRKIRLQTLDSRSEEAIFSELYGLGRDYNERHLAALAAVTPQDVLRVAREYLDPAKLTLSVVGNDKSVEAAKEVLRARAR